MILYRLTTFSDDPRDPSWTIDWWTTKDGAREAFLFAYKQGIEAVVHRTDVPTDKAGLAEALCRAHDNPVNWPWKAEEIFSTRKEARTT